MKGVRSLFVLSVAVASAACDKGREWTKAVGEEAAEANRTAKDLSELAAATPALTKSLMNVAVTLHGALAENDYEKARHAAAAIDRFFKSRTLTWYVQIMVVEEKEGVPAAKQKIQELQNTPDISDQEKDGLTTILRAFNEKGDTKSADLTLTLCAGALAGKYGQHAGTAFLALQHTFRPTPLTEAALTEVLGDSLGKSPGASPAPATGK
ncbi:MAG: hypothetical protein QM755_06245 [Luteolibacter sp.]